MSPRKRAALRQRIKSELNALEPGERLDLTHEDVLTLVVNLLPEANAESDGRLAFYNRVGGYIIIERVADDGEPHFDAHGELMIVREVLDLGVFTTMQPGDEQVFDPATISRNALIVRARIANERKSRLALTGLVRIAKHDPRGFVVYCDPYP